MSGRTSAVARGKRSSWAVAVTALERAVVQDAAYRATTSVSEYVRERVGGRGANGETETAGPTLADWRDLLARVQASTDAPTMAGATDTDVARTVQRLFEDRAAQMLRLARGPDLRQLLVEVCGPERGDRVFRRLSARPG